MGYQPALDGLRALSVIAVVWYHAGFTWMPGGFVGVEVFFVVSGFLITTLLLDEHGRTGRISLAGFWRRRARRLLPALFAVLVAVAGWAAVWGSAAQVSELRRDLPWSIFYLANWGQILGDVPYFATGDPPLLRHLWSLAVEEQWYLVWPLVAVLLLRSRRDPLRVAGGLAAVAIGMMVFTAWIASGSSPVLGGPPAVFEGADRVNFAYLSTITRSSGLLLGAAAAFVWRPWRSPVARRASARPLDTAAGLAIGVLVCVALAASLTDVSTYRWVLPLTSLSALVAVLAAVHPAASGTRQVLSQPALVALGRRSYGLYLWHWPVFVIAGATTGEWRRVVPALAITAIVTELSFRFVEEPIRHGALADWRDRLRGRAVVPAGALAAAVTALVLFYVDSEPFDPAVGGEEVAFVAPTTEPPTAGGVVAAAPTTVTTVAAGPPTVVVLGDSQAHSLAVNVPDGLAATLAVDNGAVPGCSVHDRGSIVTEREGFENDFAICDGWQDDWAAAAADVDLALVLLGAWDVFDLRVEGVTYPFATPQSDDLFRRNLRSGIDAVLATGTPVALLEAPCMRPVSADGAAVPPLPERGDDARVAHVNDLLREVAAGYGDPDRVAFVEGPDEWCADEAIATDLGYRWDGVHVYRPGAALIFEEVTADLLALARPR